MSGFWDLEDVKHLTDPPVRERGLRNIPVMLRPGPEMGWGQENVLPGGGCFVKPSEN